MDAVRGVRAPIDILRWHGRPCACKTSFRFIVCQQPPRNDKFSARRNRCLHFFRMAKVDIEVHGNRLTGIDVISSLNFLVLPLR